MTDLRELADRCERASGADRGLNVEIADAIGLGRRLNAHSAPKWQYTASLDAAMTLVPKRWRTVTANEQNWEPNWVWRLGTKEEDESQFGRTVVVDGVAATPALALCAAALRAFATTREQSNHD